MADASGRSEVLEVDGNRKIPSMVVVDDDGTIVVGVAAAGLARSKPERTIRTPKDRLGDHVPVVVGGAPYQPVSFVSAVLEHVLADATRFQGSPPSRSRLTYPATWNRPKRVRLLEAAAKAGYPDPELVAEPIAAALTHAHIESLRIGDHVAVYDLGGGTFDTVVLLRTAEGFSVVGDPLGDPQLGGELFDEILMNHVGEQIDPALWEELLVSDHPDWVRASARLRAECKRTKEALSTHPVAEVSVGLPGGQVAVRITREELDQLIAPYVDESIALLARCMSDAAKDGDSISAIYVTGGASRMPLVEKRVREAYPNTAVSRRGDPKVAVVLGALLADPGSTDTSLGRRADGTTDDTEARVITAASPTPATPPKPPVVAVPPGPDTRAPQRTEVGAQVPVEPSVQGGAATFVGNAGPVEADGISIKVALSSLLGVLGLGVVIALFVIPRFGGDDTAPVVVAESATESTTTTSASSSTTTTTAPTTTIAQGIDDTSGDDAPSEPLRFETAQLVVDDLGFGWAASAEGPDLVNMNLCQLDEPIVPVDESVATFTTATEQLTSDIELFANASDAGAALAFTSTLRDLCPAPAIPFTATEVLTGRVVPLEAKSGDQLATVQFPDLASETVTLAYQFENELRPSRRPNVLVARMRVVEAVGSLVLFTPGEPTVAEIDFLTAMLDDLASNLEGVQR